MTSKKQKNCQDQPSTKQHRRQVSHDVEVESLDSKDEADFPSSAIHPEFPSISKARHTIDVPRTTEIPETQEIRQEAVELDHTRAEHLDMNRRSYHMSGMAFNSRKYFSKAIEQLKSPEMVPHSVTRYRFRQELDEEASGSSVILENGPSHHVNLSPLVGEQKYQKQKGSLHLGVTPRLKRRMSNVPFRPPFMEPL